MKILLAVSRYPWPPRRGDQLRTVQTLETLGGEHEVTLLAPEPPAGSEPPPPLGRGLRLVTYRRRPGWRAVLGLARAFAAGLPLQCGLYDHPDLERQIRRRAPEVDLGILQLVRLAAHRDAFGSTPVVVDFIDSLGLNVARRARFDRRGVRPLLAFEARRLFAAEARLLETARAGTLVSERDREALATRVGPELAARLAVVPLAVLAPPGPPASADPAVSEAVGPPVAAITGNLGYFVNQDAVLWFLRRVWGPLYGRRGDLHLRVAGARPSRRLRRKVERAGGELIPTPPDLMAILARSTVALAPMRCGSGVPVKILEAWSAGVPVVASPWAAAGVGGRSGEDLLVADTPGEWVEAILHLLDAPDARRRLAAGGFARLAEHTPRQVRRRWLELVEPLDR